MLPSREALILLAVINHPWLLETHAEDLAALEFRHPDGERLRRAILDASSGHTLTPAALRAAIAARELGTVLARVEGSDHAPVGLAGARGRGAGGREPLVDPRCQLASQVADVK